MSCEPAEPGVRHVWVHSPARIGPPDPGVVVDWQRAPVHTVNTSAWVALVARCPFDAALVVEWVSADRLVAVHDPRPVDPSLIDAG